MQTRAKDIIILLLIMLPMFAAVIFGISRSPMMQGPTDEEVAQAQGYLMRNYYRMDNEMRNLANYYGLTDDDINPKKMLEKINNGS